MKHRVITAPACDMLRILRVAETGLAAVPLHSARSIVIVLALLAVLVPFLTGLAISAGFHEQTQLSLDHGADMYVSGEQFGRPAPVEQSVAETIRGLPGVKSATPRVVGRVEIGSERIEAIVIGISMDQLPAQLECIEGRLYRNGPRNELVIGSDLARRLRLNVGSLIPPFYSSREGEHVSEVVGIFRADASPWQARVILTSVETAAKIFDQPGLATDLIVHCHAGYESQVLATISRIAVAPTSNPSVRTRVQTREALRANLSQGPARREGVWTLSSIFAFATAILVVLATSGIGLSERRREVAILKLTGWQTEDVLLRCFVESLAITVLGTALAIVIAYAWLEWFNGYAIAALFIPGADASVGFDVPYRFVPGPILISTFIAIVVVMTGSLYATWRAATAQPREAIR